ncbi:MAG: hypothetical protein WD575_00370, partial [Nitriliruptoraceae bacterium]
EARRRLAAGAEPMAQRYRGVEARADVIPLLRADYRRDDVVRRTVDDVVTDLVFLGRLDREFASLSVRNPPRGLRWWWTALTGEILDRETSTAPPASNPPRQLTLDDVFGGYGDG